MAAVNAIGLVLAIIANFVLIPRFGVVGSAISISLCEALMFVMRSYVCREFLSGIRGLIDPIRIFCSAGFSGIAAYIVLALCDCSAWNAFLWLVCGGILFSIIYGTALLVCREQFVTGMIRPILNKIQGLKGRHDEICDLRTFPAPRPRWFQSTR